MTSVLLSITGAHHHPATSSNQRSNPEAVNHARCIPAHDYGRLMATLNHALRANANLARELQAQQRKGAA